MVSFVEFSHSNGEKGEVCHWDFFKVSGEAVDSIPLHTDCEPPLKTNIYE